MLISCLAALSFLLSSTAQSPTELRLPLRVLYASDAGTPYSAGWKDFFAAHTTEVRAVSRDEVTLELVRAFDVLVIDGELKDGDRYKETDERVPLPLSKLQGRPVVLMGGVGGRLSTTWGLASRWGIYGYHCLNPTLVVPPVQDRTEVFTKPFSIEEAPQHRATPKNYLEHDPGMAAQLDILPVFEGDPNEPGYVTRGDFRALPDSEWLASGINSKSAGHAAILRHGSFVLWGFHGPAQDLTSVGQKLLLNSIACAHAHAGNMVENLRLAWPREELLAMYQRLAPKLEPEERGKELEFLLTPGFPAAVLEDPSKVTDWFAKARGQLRMPVGTYGFEIDQHCVELGPGNDSPQFLETIAKRLSEKPEDELALELLAKYVPAAPSTGASEWLRAHRDQLYFTDVGGYVWKLKGERADVLRPMRVTGLAASAPMRVTASANDEEIVIELDVRVGWHLYARAQEKFTPLTLTPVTGSRALAGKLDVPADEHGWLTRRVTLHLPLAKRGYGNVLGFDLSFQLCDADSCRPVETVRIER